jgi:lysine 2,3-aminomutase
LKLIEIKTLSALEDLLGEPLKEDDAKDWSELLQRFPVRFSDHLLKQLKDNPLLAKQFLPSIQEVRKDGGASHCFKGLLGTGIKQLERVYLDRCIIMPQPQCPAYCRFCFRKFYEHSQTGGMSETEMRAAIDYIGRDQRIWEVLVTGGEPVMDKRRLRFLLAGLREIPQVQTIRIACRSIVTAPDLIDDSLIELLTEYQDLENGRSIEVASHCNHAEELSSESVATLVRLRLAGIHVYNQAVLMRGINCDAAILEALFRKLRSHGVECYNLFFAGPVLGLQHIRPTLQEALALKSALRRRLSGRANPHLIVTTRLGKVELGVDGWVVRRETDSSFVWIRTPYRLESYTAIDRNFELPDDAYLDSEGQIVIRYLDGEASEPDSIR